MDDLVITINDVRQTGRCTAGAKRWFRAHGLDFARFLKEGLPAEMLLATGDAIAKEVVEKAQARARANG